MSLINPSDTLERQNEKLLTIAQSLMRRVEQKNEQSGLAYQQFERAALLETEVRERTHDLERALDLLQESNARLELANDETEKARSNLTEAIETINEGFALFEREEGLVLSNSRFCRDFEDIAAGLVPGLKFEDYVALISQSDHISLPKGQSARDWAARRLSKHANEHAVFNVRLKWDRWLQVSEHRTSRGGTVILQTDVTTIIRRERRERDKMRDQQAEILQATLDHLNQGVCIFDKDQTLMGWNSRMDGLLAGSPDRGVLGMSFELLLDQLEGPLAFDDTLSAQDLRDWVNSPKQRNPIAFEVTRGSAQTFSVFAQEMPGRGFVISFTDVTSERAAARTLSEMNELLERRVQDRTRELGVALSEAERANASKSRFVAAASHDLLQPLSAAKLFVSSLSEQIATPEAQDVMDKTQMALNSVEQFISSLLDISKLDADKAVFEVQPLRLSQIFEPLRNEMTPQAQAKGLDLQVLDSDLVVLSDPGYLRRIVQNLLSNAIRYTDAGRILLGVRRQGDTARIEVWDTGRGIAPGDQALIFKEFERVSPTRSDMGLGLGLAIVERACEGLGHAFNLWSEPGRGSCFSLNVPIKPIRGQRPKSVPLRLGQGREAETGTGMGIGTGKLILLVEPNPDEALVATALIETLDATVIHVHDTHEAMDILGEIQLLPDALLISQTTGTSLGDFAAYGEIFATFGTMPGVIIASDPSDALQQASEALGLQLVKQPIEVAQIESVLLGGRA